MGSINPTLDNRVRFVLKNENLEPLTITDPIGWEEDDKEYTKVSNYDGLFTKFSNNLEFVGTGASFLSLVDELYGVKAEVLLLKEEKHPKTDIWTNAYKTHLDIMTITSKDGVVSIKANSGGLEKNIKARRNEDVELERRETLNGKPIPPLSIALSEIRGREVFLESSLEIADIYKDENHLRIRSRDGFRIGRLTVPLAITYISDDLVNGVFRGQYSEGSSLPNGLAEAVFYGVNDRDKRLDLEFSLDFILNVSDLSASGGFLGVYLEHYENGTSYDLKERKELYLAPDIGAVNGSRIVTGYNDYIDLSEGESLAFVWIAGGYFSGGIFSPNDYMYMNFNVQEASLTVREDSSYGTTQTNVVLPFEALNRLLYIVTGRDDALYSEALGRTDIGYEKDGIASLVAVAHGFWIRGFADGDELYKGITTSLKDFLESYLAVFNLGMGIETRGFKEIVRIERKSYFYNRNTTIRLGKEIDGVFNYIKVSGIEESKIPELFYSSVEVGYEKPKGDRLYEEAVGLIEHNGLNTYTTSVDSGDSILRLVSKFRADIMAVEFARRKPKLLFPKEDTSYDKDLIMLDLIRTETGVFRFATWEDHFEQPPTGIYSPETAGNLRLSPFNIFLRNSSMVSSGLTKYPDDYIRYASSSANSNLGTKLIGGEPYVENQPDGIIKNSDLDSPRFIPKKLKFKFPVSFELSQKMQEKSNILGNLVPNNYGLVELQDSNGYLLKGYLEKLKPNGDGTWELKQYTNNG